MRFLLVVVSLVIILPTAAFHLGYRLNYTSSVPRGFYRAVGGEAKVGDLVGVCLPAAISRVGLERGYLGAGSCTDGAMPVLKFVLASGGDVVELDWSFVSVVDRGSYRLETFTEDAFGRSLAAVSRGRYRLGSEELWLVSASHARSWDSRYYGPVLKSAVRSVFEPVLTLRSDLPGWPEQRRRGERGVQ